MPLLISTVVMFQAQNSETINSTWKVAVSFEIIMTKSVQDRVSQHNNLQDQDHDQDRSVQDEERYFLVSDRYCPKTDGLIPHHWYILPESVYLRECKSRQQPVFRYKCESVN